MDNTTLNPRDAGVRYLRALPTELVDSKNRKKMATASSETTLTDLRGCLERTLEATSCTQMLSDILCDMRTRSVANPNMPDGSTCPWLCRSLSPEVVISTYWRRMALNVEGSAASSTETASTIAMSSSSVRWASCAAASSSCAMPSDTEKARSEPREPSAPAVVMRPSMETASEPTRSSDLPSYSATTAEIKLASGEGCSLRAALPCQQIPTLPLRQLFIMPNTETKTPGRGGKALRQRVGSTHRHFYSECVFGCLIGAAIDFVRRRDERTVDVMRTLCTCLRPAGSAIMTCHGADVAHLQRGFASNHAIRGQVVQLPESRTCSRIDARYGKKSVVLGVSVCVYFVLCSLATYDDNSSAVSIVARDWLGLAVRVLGMWRSSAQASGPYQCAALEAEVRALQRGVAALEQARAESVAKELETKTAATFELACLSRAMWPSGRRIDADAQQDLLDWIRSDAFRQEEPPKPVQRSYVSESVSMPLSAVSCLPGSREGSSCGSASSSSLGSASSAGSVGGLDTCVADLNL